MGGRCDLDSFECTVAMHKATCGETSFGFESKKQNSSCGGQTEGTYGCKWKWHEYLEGYETYQVSCAGVKGKCGYYECTPNQPRIAWEDVDESYRCLDGNDQHNGYTYINNENRRTARASCGSSRNCKCCRISDFLHQGYGSDYYFSDARTFASIN